MYWYTHTHTHTQTVNEVWVLKLVVLEKRVGDVTWRQVPTSKNWKQVFWLTPVIVFCSSQCVPDVCTRWPTRRKKILLLNIVPHYSQDFIKNIIDTLVFITSWERRTKIRVRGVLKDLITNDSVYRSMRSVEVLMTQLDISSPDSSEW